MPLDTAPLSRPRKLIALCVLVAFLGGSLGLAQYIVATHKPAPRPDFSSLFHEVDFIVATPDNFKVDRFDEPTQTNDRWVPLDPKRGVSIERSDDLVDIELPLALRRQEFNQQNIAALIKRGIHPRFVRTVPFGGIEADFFIGTDRTEKPVIMYVTVGLRDHYMVLLYSGDNQTTASALTQADEAVLLEMCRKSRVVVDGVELAPQTAPTTR